MYGCRNRDTHTGEEQHEVCINPEVKALFQGLYEILHTSHREHEHRRSETDIDLLCDDNNKSVVLCVPSNQCKRGPYKAVNEADSLAFVIFIYCIPMQSLFSGKRHTFLPEFLPDDVSAQLSLLSPY